MQYLGQLRPLLKVEHYATHTTKPLTHTYKSQTYSHTEFNEIFLLKLEKVERIVIEVTEYAQIRQRKDQMYYFPAKHSLL